MDRRSFLKTFSAAAASITAPHSFAAEAVASSKRGCCFSARDESWLERVQKLSPSWMYTWGLDRPTELPAEIEFAPMLWGEMKAENRAQALAGVAKRFRSGEVRHLMSFNEPDQKKQGNMTVERVVELWPELMAVGVPLVSPGCVHPDRDWMRAFMKQVDARNLRVDAVAVHSYGGPGVESLVRKLTQVHEEFGRPLWITEFAVGDWEATTPEGNRHSPARVAAFMREVLPALDELPFLERYAWFSASPSSAPLGTSALFTEDNQLTALGEIYQQ